MVSKKKPVADTTRSGKGSKMANGKKSKSKNSRNGIGKNVEEETEVLIVPSSSGSDSPNNGDVEAESEAAAAGGGEEEEVEEEEVVESSAVKNQRSKKREDTKKKGKNQKKSEEELEDKKDISLYQFPMHRVSRIIKSEDPSIRITQEAVFLINKASEKFLHLFSTEAYASSFLDRKKFVGYKHLSAVVSKRKRFDFLSDFVPEKVKAEDALKETPTVES